jgi:hypothetical protein
LAERIKNLYSQRKNVTTNIFFDQLELSSQQLQVQVGQNLLWYVALSSLGRQNEDME